MRRWLARPAALAAAGAAIALVATMCGIGGGLFVVPLLHFGAGLPLRRAVATGLCLVAANAIASTTTELLADDGRLDLGLAAAAAVASLAGAQVGFRASEQLGGRALRALFAVVLAFAGLRVLLAGGAAAPASGGALDPGVEAFAVAGLAGLGGGFLAPILGIGGGLVLVPALYLGIPGLGFGGARACSMAVAIVTGARALGLHARAGRVDRERGLPLAAGAALGAVLGVELVHAPGWVERARWMLGVVLLLVALRFALELLHGSGEEA